MEVGEQRAHQAELEAGGDEDLRLAGVRLKRAAGGCERAVLQRAHHRGSDGHNAAALACGAVNGLRCCGGQRVALAVQTNLVQRSTRSGAKVPRPTCSVTRAISTPRAASASRICGVKCSRRWARRRSRARERRPSDSARGRPARRRGGCRAAGACGRCGRDGEEIVDRLETEKAFAEFAALQHLGFELDCAGGRRKDEKLADGNFAARTDQARQRFRRRGLVVSHPFREDAEWMGHGAFVGNRLGEHHFNAPVGFSRWLAARSVRRA